MLFTGDCASKTYLQSMMFACSMEELETFLNDFLAGKLEAYLKSEPVPDNSGQGVKVRKMRSIRSDLCSKSVWKKPWLFLSHVWVTATMFRRAHSFLWFTGSCCQEFQRNCERWKQRCAHWILRSVVWPLQEFSTKVRRACRKGEHLRPVSQIGDEYRFYQFVACQYLIFIQWCWHIIFITHVLHYGVRYTIRECNQNGIGHIPWAVMFAAEWWDRHCDSKDGRHGEWRASAISSVWVRTIWSALIDLHLVIWYLWKKVVLLWEKCYTFDIFILAC